MNSTTTLPIGGNVAPEELEHIRQMLVAVQITENFLNFIFSFYFVRLIGRTALIHPNMRLLLTSALVVPFILVALGRMCEQFNESAWALAAKPRLVTNLACAVCRLTLSTGVGTASTSILMLALERLLATAFSRTYEVRGKSIAFVINLVVYSVAAALGLIHMVLDMAQFDWEHETQSCSSDEFRPAILIFYWIAALVFCNTGIVMMLALCWWNKRKMRHTCVRQSAHYLAARYQHSENLATMRALLPGVIPYALIAVACVPVWHYLTNHYNLMAPMDSNLLRLHFQIFYMLSDMYAVVVKALFLALYAPLRSQMFRDMRYLCGRRRVAVDNNGGFGAGYSDESTCPGSGATARLPARLVPHGLGTDAKAISQMYFNQLDNAWQPTRRRTANILAVAQLQRSRC